MIVNNTTINTIINNIQIIVNDLSTTNIILICAGLFLMLLFLLLKQRKTAQNTQSKAEHDNAQNVYSARKTVEDKVTLSLEEKLQLSWEFLYDITEKIINTFSPTDKATVERIGDDLVRKGMRYQHIIDFAIRPKATHAKGANIENTKEQSNVQGR